MTDEERRKLGRTTLALAGVVVLLRFVTITTNDVSAVGLKFSVDDPAMVYGAVGLVYLYKFIGLLSLFPQVVREREPISFLSHRFVVKALKNTKPMFARGDPKAQRDIRRRTMRYWFWMGRFLTRSRAAAIIITMGGAAIISVIDVVRMVGYLIGRWFS